jgi:DNA-directed RNA polymerase subunit H
MISSLARKKTKKIDVLAHVLVPPHSLLTRDETKHLLRDYSIRLVDLPRIFEDDPACLAVGGKEGDVIKIVRKSDTMVDKVDTYRFVVIRRV